MRLTWEAVGTYFGFAQKHLSHTTNHNPKTSRNHPEDKENQYTCEKQTKFSHAND